jgi:GNAT superfamily N-acetyltransferase
MGTARSQGEGGRMPGIGHRPHVAAAMEENLWSMWSQFGLAKDGALHDEGGALWFETPIPVPPYNMVVKFQGDAQADTVIDRIFAHFRSRGVPFVWLVHPSAQPADLRSRLQSRGFEEAEPITGMAMDLAGLPPLPDTPRGVEILPVTVEHAKSAFAELVVWRWHVPEAARPHLQSIMDVVRIGAAGSPNRAWVVVKDGVALAKAFTHDAAGAVGLYGMATKPEARGMGLARLVCLNALHDARTRGQTLAILHSTPMAVSLYKGIGFAEIAPFDLYAAPQSFYA